MYYSEQFEMAITLLILQDGIHLNIFLIHLGYAYVNFNHEIYLNFHDQRALPKYAEFWLVLTLKCFLTFKVSRYFKKNC